MSEAILAYVPVIHRGYQLLFDAYPQARTLLVVGRSITESRRPFQKDVRALDPAEAAALVAATGRFDRVEVVEAADLPSAAARFRRIVMPDEDLCRDLAPSLAAAGAETALAPFFLRWDSRNVDAHLDVACPVVRPDSRLAEIYAQALAAAGHSPDQYRQVAAAAFSEADSTLAALVVGNSIPGGWEFLYVAGDPRSQFRKGSRIEVSLSLHAEAALVAELARRGRSPAGWSILATTFPCPNCAKLVAAAGFAKLYFVDGYAMLDGESVLRGAGIEIARLSVG